MRVSRENAPLVETLLQNQPVLAVTLSDDADDPVLEPGVGETPLWPSVCVTALFDGDTETAPLAQLLSLVPGIDRPQLVSFRTFDDQQWERVWLDRFKPMKFGRDLWIVPGDQTIPLDAIHIIRLDPGLAFGTGTHPTTRLCLQWVDGHDFDNQAVVDYGCGSGVLGIATAIKGAARVFCVDNDPQALTATGDNANRNKVQDALHVFAPDHYIQTRRDQAPADVLLANILAGPLIELAPLLLGSLAPGGSLVMSGVLRDQAEEVVAAYAAGLTDIQQTELEGWVLITGKKCSAAFSGQ